jgi:hypothetical protein
VFKTFHSIRALYHPALGVSALTLMALALPAQGSTSFTNGSFSQVGSATQSFSIDFAADGPNNVLTGWTAATSGQNALDCLVFNATNTNVCGTNADGGGQSFWVNPGPSPNGGNYVAIDGDSAFAVPLTQTITGLVVGQAYAVTFYQAAAQQNGFNGATTERWQVELGSQSQLSTLMSDANHSDVGWMSQSLTFTATAASEALTFIAVGTPSGEPPFVLLDGVGFTAVPEPATFALLGVGLVGIGAFGRRLKKRS